MEPDFEVRNLSEYSVEDLEHLLLAIKIAEYELKVFNRHDNRKLFKESLDIWVYRIKDAISQAKKNEVTKV